MPELKDSASITWSESGGDLEGTVQGDVSVDSVTVANGGTIGSATRPGAIEIASTGNVTLDAGNGTKLSIGPSRAGPNGIIFGDETEPMYIFRRTSGDSLTIEGPEATRLFFVNRSTGDVGIENGNVRLVTGGTGVDFSGSGTAAEILDDYEEGTWTPQLADSNGNITTNNQHGRYVKIGRQVTLQMRCTAGASGTGTALRISGLPFGVADDNTAVALEAVGVVNPTQYGSIVFAYANDSDDTLRLGDATGTVDGTDLSGSEDVRLTITYSA